MEATLNRQQYTSYKHLALRWQPSNKSDRAFNILVAIALLLGLLLGFLLSSVQLPAKPQRDRAVVPERVAQFIRQKALDLPPPPPPAPEVRQPEPKPVEPKPEITPAPASSAPERPRPQTERRSQQPLTEQQQQARESAQRSGLLAHANELRDLMETPAVSEQLKTGLRAAPQTGGGTAMVGLDTRALTANATRGSGGVNAGQYATRAGSSTLSTAEPGSTQAALEATASAFSAADTAAEGNSRARSEEEVTLVFDRHKSQLQSIYNRARRTNPALKGKLVLAVTIQPNGSVSAVKVVSSELQDQSLIDSLLARIRNFQFGAGDVEAVTVNYPIEFLPY